MNANEPNKVYVQGGSVAVTYGSANSAPKLALEPSGKQTQFVDIGKERTVTLTFYPDSGQHPEALIFVNGKNTQQPPCKQHLYLHHPR